MAPTCLFLSALLLAPVVLARTVEYNLKISNGTIAPDGVPRSATLVNGGYPGPLISANKGDTLKIKVQNMLKDPNMYLTTSIHWHGIFEHRNADDDGTAFVTQIAFISAQSFRKLRIPTSSLCKIKLEHTGITAT
ncbi:unnamed protein product [Rhizoctonia solani]|uniref:laccase n=1 Tax=Rhizoctonia solani TaxID=456999 RepID=A0A8H3GIT8_9AGAM|nr:unnamed protein product [Rhizoctonia solani]